MYIEVMDSSAMLIMHHVTLHAACFDTAASAML